MDTKYDVASVDTASVYIDLANIGEACEYMSHIENSFWMLGGTWRIQIETSTKMYTPQSYKA